MPTATFNSTSSTDMNNTGNYTAVWDATYDLVFDGTGSADAIATASISCNSVTITSAFNRVWNISGQTLTCAQGFSDDGITGAHNYGNGITCNGASATFHVGSGVGTITASSCTVTMNGTTAMVLDDDKGINMLKFVVGAGAICVSSGSATTLVTSTTTVFTIGANASMTWNRAMTWNLNGAGTFDVYTVGVGATLSQSASITVNANGNGLTAQLPAITVGGASGYLIFSSASNNQTYSITGAISAYGLNFAKTAAGTTTFNTGNNSLTAGGGGLAIGSNSAPGTVTFNAGSSTISTAVYSATFNVGTTNINWQTASITCTGSWTTGSNHTTNWGTALITFTGTGASVYTSAGKGAYDIVVNNASKAFSFADAISLHSLTTTAMASYTHIGFVLTASGDVTFDGSGTLGLGNGITMTGASSTLHINSTVGTVTASSCVVTMNTATAGVIDDDKGTLCSRLIIGPAAIVTNSGGATTSYSSSLPLTFTDGGMLTYSRAILLNLTATGDFISILAGTPTIVNASSLTMRFGGSNITGGLPALTFSSTGLITGFGGGGNFVNNTLNFNGDFATSGPLTLTISGTGTPTWTYNTNGYTITSTALVMGTTGAGNILVFNRGTSTINCSSFDVSVNNNGAMTDNLMSSITLCSGNYTLASGYTSVPGTSTQTFTGLNAVITTAGKAFGNVIVSNNVSFVGGCTMNSLAWGVDGKTITFQAGQTFTLTTLSAADWNGSAGSLNKFVSSIPTTAYTIAIPGDVTVSYVNPTDCTLTGGTVTTDPADSTDGGRNTGWLFVTLSTGASSNVFNAYHEELSTHYGIY